MWQSVDWKQILKQPDSWYRGAEAAKIADNVILYQHANGGWDKNIDMTLPPKKPTRETTIDNGSTTTQIRFLVKVASTAARESARKGLEYLLAAQYANGGWPQFYPLKKGYYSHITFNDDATSNVLRVLADAAAGERDYAFIESDLRRRCRDAVERGIACVLRCQIRTEGKLTGWPQQSDERTFAPAPARAFEPVSLCSTETAGLLLTLMESKPRTPEIERAVDAAIEWLKQNGISGYRWQKRDGENQLVADPKAPTLWARLYEIGTNRPIFGDRDGKVHYTVTEISRERRNGYAWYSTSPQKAIDAYAKWKK